MEYGQTIYNLRKKRGLSQERVAEELNVTRQSVSLWETDQASPSIDNLILLSKLFNVSIDDIVKNNIKSDIPSTDRITVTYKETRKTLFISGYYMQKIALWFYPLTYLIIFNVWKLSEMISDTEDNRFSIIASIGFLAILVIAITTLLMVERNKYKKTLLEQREFEYTFDGDKITLDICGKAHTEKVVIEYESIKKVMESKEYLILVLKNMLYYIPKTETYFEVYQWFKEKNVKFSKWDMKPSSISILKMVSVILPLLSIISVVLTAVFVTNSSDIFLWVVLTAVPISTVLLGFYSRRLIGKIYSVFSIGIGVLCFLMEFLAFIVIFLLS